MLTTVLADLCVILTRKLTLCLSCKVSQHRKPSDQSKRKMEHDAMILF